MIKGLTLKESMPKSIQAIMPIEQEKIKFNENLVLFLENLLLKQNESEEFQKNLLKDFLKECLPQQFVNTNKRIDLAIYNGKSPESTTGVLIEFKSVSNKKEMMTKEKINSKALQEIVHYYLQERLVMNNLEIKKCIITNGFSWFIIESKEIEKLFIKNKPFISLYNKWRLGQLSSQNTDFLYEEILKPTIDKVIEKGFTVAHFDLRDALKKGNQIEIKTSNLTQLYRFFSPENLLNKEIFVDSNKLNKHFYDELLYLMGLEEIKRENKKIIQRLPEEKRQSGSFVENIIDRLKMNDIPDKEQYNTAVQLTVVWINRILFLKLLESQLVSFNNEEKYKFLTKEKLTTFDDIYYLFFGVLAKKIGQRSEEMKLKFPQVPYLNSSLFEENDLELSKDGFSIDRLREREIEFYSKTVLKGTKNKRKTGKIDFLTYLFEFLDAYDFSTSIEHKKYNKNTLINASVLGLIFEKINGYSDGAFYTPGKITMYMSKSVIRDAVIQKINDVKGWNCKNIHEVEYRINRDLETAKEISSIIDSIKICDPAVGSGHFLVSVLNELIAIKSELKVLIDSDGRSMNDIQCTVVNDELIIQDINGDNFIYRRGNAYSERIQKAIFLEKRKIIENCLFGVDLNPNSVNICRLRLWIELLKNSYYYLEDGEQVSQLITLPNIDINIKIGNSLLQKFDINEDLDKRFTQIKEYLQLVTEYKNTNDKNTKKNLTEQLKEVKKRFVNNIQIPELKKLSKLSRELGKTGQLELFATKNEIKTQKNKIESINKKIKLAQLELDAAKKNPLFSNSLEWRMEFPEVLSENGEFSGFDVIIANPPYIYSMNDNFAEKEKAYFNKKYPLTDYQLNTFSLFIELSFLLLKENGHAAFIIPNTFLTLRQFSKVRRKLIDDYSNLVIINSMDKIFEDANIDNCIIFFKKQYSKSRSNLIKLMKLEKNEIKLIANTDRTNYIEKDNFTMSKYKDGTSKESISIMEKIKSFSEPLSPKYADVKDGLKAYERRKGNPPQPEDKLEFNKFKNEKPFSSNYQVNDSYRKFLIGRNIIRYGVCWSDEWLMYGENLAAPRDKEIFEGKRILIRQIPTKSEYTLTATYTDENYIHERSVMCIRDLQVDPYFVLGVLNSKILSFWALDEFSLLERKTYPQLRLYQIKELRIPICSESQRQQLGKMVELLMKTMNDNSIENDDKEQEVKKLDKEIDEFVMGLFNLNEKEKDFIRNFSLEF